MTEWLSKNDFYSNFNSCLNNVLSRNSFFFSFSPMVQSKIMQCTYSSCPLSLLQSRTLVRPQPLPQHIHKSLERMSLKFQGSCVNPTEWGDTMLSSPQSVASATCFCLTLWERKPPAGWGALGMMLFTAARSGSTPSMQVSSLHIPASGRGWFLKQHFLLAP